MGAVEIQLEEGETVEEAVLRLARLVPEDKPDTPKPKKPKKVTTSDPSTGQPVDGMVYSAVHVYQRQDSEGLKEPEGNVRANGTRERKMHGPGTLVFVHMHSFGETCTSSCKERVSE